MGFILDPRYWFPQNTGNSFWAKAWAWYYNNPQSPLAEEPPAEVKQQMKLYDQIRATSDASSTSASGSGDGFESVMLFSRN